MLINFPFCKFYVGPIFQTSYEGLIDCIGNRELNKFESHFYDFPNIREDGVANFYINLCFAYIWGVAEQLYQLPEIWPNDSVSENVNK